jgi:hypothetical protein
MSGKGDDVELLDAEYRKILAEIKELETKGQIVSGNGQDNGI